MAGPSRSKNSGTAAKAGVVSPAVFVHSTFTQAAEPLAGRSWLLFQPPDTTAPSSVSGHRSAPAA